MSAVFLLFDYDQIVCMLPNAQLSFIANTADRNGRDRRGSDSLSVCYLPSSTKRQYCNSVSLWLAVKTAGKGGDVEHIVGPYYSALPGGKPYGMGNIANVGNTGGSLFI